jgi:hypothetical protein
MKKLAALLLVLVLSGCATGVAVKMSFPEVPADLKTACPDLQQVDPATTKLSEIVSTVSANYEQYYLCKDRVDNWIDWYNTQKKISDSVK